MVGWGIRKVGAACMELPAEGSKLRPPCCLPACLSACLPSYHWNPIRAPFQQAGVIPINAPSREGYTPLMLAAGCGNAPITDALMVRGASLGARSSRGASPIAFASAGGAGSLEALRVLLAHGSCTPALVKQLGFRSRSPLVLAVINHGHVPTIQAVS